MTALAFANHDPAGDVELSLPWPPTVNHYWRTAVIGKRAQQYISEQGKAYRSEVIAKTPVAARRHLRGRLHVTITAYPPDRARRDLDNTLKATLDALAHAGVYEDDGQIDYLAIERYPVCKGGMLQVTVREIAI